MLAIALAAGLWVAASARADDWAQWGGPTGDCVWHETGIVRKLPQKDGRLPRVWSTPLGEGYSGPSVANGRVYITDFVDRDVSRGRERVLCLDAESGKILWKHEYPVRYDISYPAGPRATPVVDGDRVYTIGATGKMFCFDTEKGSVRWEKDFTKDFETQLPTWGMASAPLVDGDQLITLVGGKNALVVSFDKQSGAEKWRALNDPQIGYAPPKICTFDGTPQLIMWHPDAVSALDPRTGKKYWDVPFPVQAGLCIPTPQQVGDRLFLTSFYNGPLMLDVTGGEHPKATIEWKGISNSEKETDKLHSIMCTPIFTPTHIYGVCSYGQLRCLDARTGERVWETLEATGPARWWNAFLIPNGDRVFIHNEQGELIIANLSPKGYEEISRALLVEPTRPVGRRMTIWSHPAFAMKSVFARNDKEIVRVNLAE
jgi:outer membrane protein assembly factor BamB